MPRFAALFLSTVVLVAWAPTRADNLGAGPTPMLERADRALARALPVVFENGSFEHHSVPAFSSARHSITMGELTLKAVGRLNVHFGAGIAELVDAPAGTNMNRTGLAATVGANLALFEPTGLSVGLQVDTLRVQYGSTGFTDERILLAVTTR